MWSPRAERDSLFDCYFVDCYFACRRHCAAKSTERRLRYVTDLWTALGQTTVFPSSRHGVPNVKHNSGSRNNSACSLGSDRPRPSRQLARGMKLAIGPRARSGHIEPIYLESWPGLSRPSTTCSLKLSKKDVDARDKRGHDAGGVTRSHRNA